MNMKSYPLLAIAFLALAACAARVYRMDSRTKPRTDPPGQRIGRGQCAVRAGIRSSAAG